MPIKGANWYNWMLISDSEGCSMVMSLPTIPTNFGTLNFMSYFLKASNVKKWPKISRNTIWPTGMVFPYSSISDTGHTTAPIILQLQWLYSLAIHTARTIATVLSDIGLMSVHNIGSILYVCYWTSARKSGGGSTVRMGRERELGLETMHFRAKLRTCVIRSREGI